MVSIIFCEKIDERLGYALLFPLCLIGIGSVSWWSFTESHPDWAGDLRIYILGNKKQRSKQKLIDFDLIQKTNRFVFLFLIFSPLFVLVQAAPVILTPMVVYMYPARYSHSEALYICAILYVFSKIVEVFDHAVWNITFEILSGHSLKHVSAALGTVWIPKMLRERTIIKTN
jgi:hypothetical protein